MKTKNIIILVILIAAGALLISKNIYEKKSFDDVSDATEIMDKNILSPVDNPETSKFFTCKTDSECILVTGGAGICSCSTPINKNYESEFRQYAREEEKRQIEEIESTNSPWPLCGLCASDAMIEDRRNTPSCIQNVCGF